MTVSEPLTTYLELRESTAEGDRGAGLSHRAGGLLLLHVLELAAHGEPRGGITIVHDAGDHGGRYLEAARELAQADLAVALPDLRGHGRSEGERGHSAGLGEVVRDLKEVQQHLAYRLPLAPRMILGQGLGALYALAYALEFPGDLVGAVLLAPLWEPRFELPRASGLLKAWRRPGPDAPGRIGYSEAGLSCDPQALAARQADPLVHDRITLRAAEQAAECARSCAPRLASLGCPVLIVHGSDDPFAAAAQSSAHAGGSVEVRLVAGGRHDLLHDQGSRQTLLSIRDWIVARL